jgi:hypothetical protein
MEGSWRNDCLLLFGVLATTRRDSPNAIYMMASDSILTFVGGRRKKKGCRIGSP